MSNQGFKKSFLAFVCLVIEFFLTIATLWKPLNLCLRILVVEINKMGQKSKEGSRNFCQMVHSSLISLSPTRKVAPISRFHSTSDDQCCHDAESLVKVSCESQTLVIRSSLILRARAREWSKCLIRTNQRFEACLICSLGPSHLIELKVGLAFSWNSKKNFFFSLDCPPYGVTFSHSCITQTCLMEKCQLHFDDDDFSDWRVLSNRKCDHW